MMPILGKIKSIFQVAVPYSETKRKSKGLQCLKRDVDPETVWEVVGELGDGSFGKVYKVLTGCFPYVNKLSCSVFCLKSCSFIE